MQTEVENLLRMAQGGNAAAFGELYCVYADQLYRYALKYLGNSYDAEDAVSESTLKVFKGIKEIKSPERIKAYFFKALSNTAKTMLKRNSVGIPQEIDETVMSGENLEGDAVLRHDLTTALNTISEQERSIVLLSAVCGFSSKEISKIIDIPSATVRSKLSRALSKLRKEIEGNER